MHKFLENHLKGVTLKETREYLKKSSSLKHKSITLVESRNRGLTPITKADHREYNAGDIAHLTLLVVNANERRGHTGLIRIMHAERGCEFIYCLHA